MSVVCQQVDLNKALNAASDAVAARSTLPVLGNILLRAEGGLLVVSGTNLEISVSVAIPCVADAPLEITVPAQKLAATVGAFPPGEVKLEITPKLAKLSEIKVSAGKMSSTLKGIDANEFPVIASLADATNPVVLPLDVFTTMIENLMFNAASDQARPVLTGVMIRLTPDEDGDNATLKMEAADGFRLALKSVTLACPGLKTAVKVLIPAKSLGVFVRNVKSVKGNLRLGVTKKALVLETEKLAFTALAMEDHSFPELSTVIPKNSPTMLRVSRPALKAAIALAEVIAVEASHTVKLVMKNSTLNVLALSAEAGSNESEVECAEVVGPSLTVAFNGKYLLEALNALNTDEVKLFLASPTSPGILRPATQVEGDLDWLYEMMPMHIG